jgi:hypothetical protein
MKHLLTAAVLAVSPAVPAALELTAAERAALAQQPGAELAELRAGKADGPAAVAAPERAALLRAAAASPKLETLRAGDHDDLTVVAVVLAVVLIVLIV